MRHKIHSGTANILLVLNTDNLHLDLHLFQTLREDISTLLADLVKDLNTELNGEFMRQGVKLTFIARTDCS